MKGINRYIVGCKYKNLKAVDTWKLELIDTQWDVNKFNPKII